MSEYDPRYQDNGIVSFGEDDFIFLRNNQDIAELVATNKVYTYSTRVLQSISEISYNEIYRNSFEFLYTDDFEPQHGAFLFLSKKGYVEHERKRTDKTPRKTN
ncbi:hypothetical protein CXIVA_01910 [Clostridium sp. SY8519]|nr:hypothetical protein CXIVA_01910 [Clostridium sp. SY8519]